MATVQYHRQYQQSGRTSVAYSKSRSRSADQFEFVINLRTQGQHNCGYCSAFPLSRVRLSTKRMAIGDRPPLRPCHR